MAFTVTKNTMLPATVTGSWPRPRWFDVSMWAKPLDTCMLDIRFREKFQDALAVVISDEERAGLDILTHGDFHCDEDFGGRSWHHYPLQRWTGFEGDHLQSEETRSEWLRYPPGTLLNEIYTGWRWPRVTGKIEHRPLDYAKIWRLAQSKTQKPVRFGTCCSQVMGLFSTSTPTSTGQPRDCLGHGGRDEHGAARASGRGCHPDRGTNAALHGQHLRRKTREGQVHGRVHNREVRGSTMWRSGSTPAGAIPTCSE